MKLNIGTAVVARRFRARQRRVAAVGGLAVVGAPTLIWLAMSDLFGGLLPQLFVALAGSLILIAISGFYILYRCPNCHGRPWGRTWVGLNPRRCPSCKVGLTIPEPRDEP